MTVKELDELNKLHDYDELSKEDLLSIIKVEASEVDIWKIMKATDFLKEDAKICKSLTERIT